MSRPRFFNSLMAKAIGLIVFVMAGMTATVGLWASGRMVASFQRELDRRGNSLLEVLERHQDLHAALVAKDRATVDNVLERTLASNDDLAYLAALDADGNVVASAAKGAPELATVLAELPHHGLSAGRAVSDDRMRRFTQPMLPFIAGQGAAGRRLLGHLVMGIRAERARHHVRLQAIPVALTAATLVIVFFGFFGWLSRRTRRMVRFAEELAGGRLATALEDERPDELGRLAVALRELRDSSRVVLEELREAADSLAAASSEVLEAAEAQLNRANRQALTVKQTGSAVMELRQTSQQATAKAEAVVELAKRSEASSSGGHVSVQQAAQAMAGMREQIEAVDETLEKLVQQTSQIASIIAVVTDLAQQSNMVALNANIEAVRAGEAGKGFALVAKEVRSLSDLSRRSTEQVRGILDQIALAAGETTRVVQEGRRRADSGVELAGAAGEAIAQLAETISQSSQAATQIAGSIRHQTLGVEQIGRAIEEIDRDARDATKGIALLRHASEDIKTHSDRMQVIVKRYQLESG